MCQPSTHKNSSHSTTPTQQHHTTTTPNSWTASLGAWSLADSFVGHNLLSPNATENPTFAGYTHVYLPYCSKDLWSGNTTDDAPPFAPVEFDGRSVTMQFRGDEIFRGALDVLLSRYGLRRARNVF